METVRPLVLLHHQEVLYRHNNVLHGPKVLLDRGHLH